MLNKYFDAFPGCWPGQVDGNSHKISISADGVPCSWVSARLLSAQTHIDPNRNLSAHMSGVCGVGVWRQKLAIF